MTCHHPSPQPWCMSCQEQEIASLRARLAEAAAGMEQAVRERDHERLRADSERIRADLHAEQAADLAERLGLVAEMPDDESTAEVERNTIARLRRERDTERAGRERAEADAAAMRPFLEALELRYVVTGGDGGGSYGVEVCPLCGVEVHGTFTGSHSHAPRCLFEKLPNVLASNAGAPLLAEVARLREVETAARDLVSAIGSYNSAFEALGRQGANRVEMLRDALVKAKP